MEARSHSQSLLYHDCVGSDTFWILSIMFLVVLSQIKTQSRLIGRATLWWVIWGNTRWKSRFIISLHYMRKAKNPARKTVDEYILSFPKEDQDVLQQVRWIIKKASPDAEELISYQMPAFRFHGRFVRYAVYQRHFWLYLIPKVLDVFRDRLKDYKLTKSCIAFPLGKPLPEELIFEIIQYAALYNQKNERY